MKYVLYINIYIVYTFANNIANVSKTAALTFQLKRSPKIRIKGPVIATTEGCSAGALVTLIISPKPCAAASFSSPSPFKIASLNIGNIGVIPKQLFSNVSFYYYYY